ncbi:MAG: hypothetical protein HZB81_07050 [Deltaproteobacteria bacterium]|nr:hypothetical protein [Deltaproteobacteria bacterium]
MSIAREQGAVCLLIDRRCDTFFRGSAPDLSCLSAFTVQISYDSAEMSALDSQFKEIDSVITSATTDIILLARAKGLSAVTADNMKAIIMKNKTDCPLVEATISREEVIRLVNAR